MLSLEPQVVISPNLTMSSHEISELVSKRHDHVLRDVRQMLVGIYGDAEVSAGMPDKDAFEAFCDKMGWGIDSPKLGDERIQGVKVHRDSRGYIGGISLDYTHTMTLIAGYNVKLRKVIIDRWQQLEQEHKSSLLVPNFDDPAAAARAWADQYEARRLAEKTKAQIGNKREATAMATASAAVRKAEQLRIELDKAKDYATVKRMEALFPGHKFDWRMLKAATNELGLQALDVFDQNYGTIKAYPSAAWQEAYAVRLTDTGAEIVY